MFLIYTTVNNYVVIYEIEYNNKNTFKPVANDLYSLWLLTLLR